MGGDEKAQKRGPQNPIPDSGDARLLSFSLCGIYHKGVELTLGYSPCPNDTFIFYALAHGLIDTGGLKFRETLLDVETLNEKALRAELDITKVSCHAYAYLKGVGGRGPISQGLAAPYRLLHSGGAMTKGGGPIVVAREDTGISALRGKKIAVPGRLTTAYLLLRLYDRAVGESPMEMRFDAVMPAVRDGKAEAGLVIHEGRFTYRDYGLKCVMDLGKWWQEETGLPLPLGVIIAKRTLGEGLMEKVDSLIRESVLYAMKRPDEPMGYIKAHAQELSDDVIRRHIAMYVNDYSIDMGADGIEAVNALTGKAESLLSGFSS